MLIRQKRNGKCAKARNVCGKSVLMGERKRCNVSSSSSSFAAFKTGEEEKLQFFIRNPIPHEIDVQMFSFPFYYYVKTQKTFSFPDDDADFISGPKRNKTKFRCMRGARVVSFLCTFDFLLKTYVQGAPFGMCLSY